jgi:hypothetical protein
MFALGFICGSLMGGTIGAVIMAAMCAGKDSNFWPLGPDEIPNVCDNKPINDNHTHQQETSHHG